MSSSPLPRPTVNFFTVAILLFGGCVSGIHLSAVVVPYSRWADLVGFFMFPVAFLLGMQLWPRVGAFTEKVGLLLRANHKQSHQYQRLKTQSQQVKGAFTFILTSIVISALAGGVNAPPATPFWDYPGFRVFVVAGAVYGSICWLLIQLRYLGPLGAYPQNYSDY